MGVTVKEPWGLSQYLLGTAFAVQLLLARHGQESQEPGPYGVDGAGVQGTASHSP